MNRPIIPVILLFTAFLGANETDQFSVIKKSFDREMGRAKQSYDSKVATLRSNYRNSLEKLMGAAMSSGNADFALTLKDEITLIDSQVKIEFSEDDETLNPRVRDLRRKYNSARKSYFEERSKSETELRKIGINALENLSRVIAKTGDLEKLEKIKKLSDEWKAAQPIVFDSNTIAKIEPASEGVLKTFREGEILWSDKPVEIKELPRKLNGLSFVLCSKISNAVKITSPGKIYALTSGPDTGNDRSAELIETGFSKSDIEPFQLYGSHPADIVEIYEKTVMKGEILNFRKYAILIGED